jgi:hypothetical protein
MIRQPGTRIGKRILSELKDEAHKKTEQISSVYFLFQNHIQSLLVGSVTL